MATSQQATIVVGVDGSSASNKALDWAAHEAGRRGLPLTLVNAGYYHYGPPLSPDTVSRANQESATYSGSVMHAAAARASQLDRGLEIRTVVHTESPASYLISQSESAAMIVLGTHGQGNIVGAILGSISQSVAAHAHCPVVVVNDHLAAAVERKSSVVVGISPTKGGEQALRFAFEEARLRRCRLVAVRSWGELGWGAGALNYAGEILQDWRAVESTVLDECIEAIAPDFPEVQVDRQLSGAGETWALEQAAMEAELLVVGCRHSDDNWFSRLGPIGSWLLHRAPCPIVVVGRPAEKASEHIESSAPATERGLAWATTSTDPS